MSWSPLFSDIVCSSIWNEDDHTRLVWVTMLAIKGGNQVVRATIGGLAHQARVPVEGCRKAIEKLCSPDPDGLDQPWEGRRIQPVEHGWLVLNGETYRNRRDGDDRKAYQAEWARNNRAKRKLETSTNKVDASTNKVNESTASTNGDRVDPHNNNNLTTTTQQQQQDPNAFTPPHRSSFVDPANLPFREAGLFTEITVQKSIRALLKYLEETHNRRFTHRQFGALMNRFAHVSTIDEIKLIVNRTISNNWKNPIFPDEMEYR
jgi:hypothetical protein